MRETFKHCKSKQQTSASFAVKSSRAPGPVAVMIHWSKSMESNCISTVSVLFAANRNIQPTLRLAITKG